jgi:uncharacterized protein with PQ loop repeat
MAAGEHGPNIFLSFYPGADRTGRVAKAKRNPPITMTDLPLIAGSVSTVIFATSYMPMLFKAVRTKDLSSYSPTQLVLTNIGNVLYSAYVFNLPLGPIWALHSFYLVSTALMLAWYVRYARESWRPVGKVDGTRATGAARIRVGMPRSAPAVPVAAG